MAFFQLPLSRGRLWLYQKSPQLWPPGKVCWPSGHSVLLLTVSFFLSQPNLERRQHTSSSISWWSRFIKRVSDMGPFHQNVASENHRHFGAISDNIVTWSWISPWCKKISSVGKGDIANCNVAVKMWHNEMYFDPQTTKNRTGVSTDRKKRVLVTNDFGRVSLRVALNFVVDGIAKIRVA